VIENRKQEILKLLEQTSLMCREKLKLDQLYAVFESLVSVILMNYKKGLSTYIPYIGNIKIKFLGQKIVKKGISANLEITIEADQFLEHDVLVLEKEDIVHDELYITKIIKEKNKNIFSSNMEG
jgi:hypothetical protein